VPGETHGTGEAVDLSAGAGSGPLWGMAGDDLNATLLAWPPGAAVALSVHRRRGPLQIAPPAPGDG
jgi:hypothetical protein